MKKIVKIGSIIAVIGGTMAAVISFFTLSGIADEMVVSEEEHNRIEARRDIEHDRMDAKRRKDYWETQQWITEQQMIELEEQEEEGPLTPTEERKKVRLGKALDKADEQVEKAEEVLESHQEGENDET